MELKIVYNWDLDTIEKSVQLRSLNEFLRDTFEHIYPREVTYYPMYDHVSVYYDGEQVGSIAPMYVNDQCREVQIVAIMACINKPYSNVVKHIKK